MQVHAETLKVTDRRSYTVGKGKNAKVREFDCHEVEITIKGDRRAVPCSVFDGCITILGLAVRFPTGTKVWPAKAIYWLESGNVNNLRPNIDKFHNQNCSLVGFFADFADKTCRSRHNAVT